MTDSLRDVLTSPLKVVITYQEWKDRNPDLILRGNWIDCPYCDGGRSLDTWADAHCPFCSHHHKYNDLFSLYLNDIEHDIRLIFALYPPENITPRLKAFLARFGCGSMLKVLP